MNIIKKKESKLTEQQVSQLAAQIKALVFNYDMEFITERMFVESIRALFKQEIKEKRQ
jgi:hypothetical protein